jgi:hypothetical protein
MWHNGPFGEPQVAGSLRLTLTVPILELLELPPHHSDPAGDRGRATLREPDEVFAEHRREPDA